MNTTRREILGPHYLTTSYGSGWGGAIRTDGKPRLDVYCHTRPFRRDRGLHRTETAAIECVQRALEALQQQAGGA